MSLVSQIRSELRGALFLEDATFEALRDAPDGVVRGLRFIVALALAVGLVVSLVGFVQGVTSTPAAEIDTAMDGVTRVFEQLGNFGVFGDDPEVANTILDNIRGGMAMGKGIAETVTETTPAPPAAVTFFQQIGKWLSWPFSWIALWLLWGVLTLFFARFLGGTATIQTMLATTSLVAAPHLLDALGWIPCLGPLVGVLAWIWGVVIYVKATAVANRFSLPAALLAVLLPVLAPILLGLCALLFFFALGYLAGAGTG